MRRLCLLLVLAIVVPTTSLANRLNGSCSHHQKCNHCISGHKFKLTEEEATELVSDVFIYALPLIMMNTTREMQTNVASITPPPHVLAPINQLALPRLFGNASYTDVSAVNTDTLSGRAYMDLTQEPMVLHVPAMDDSPTGSGKRWFVIPVHDSWTNVYYTIGSRTTGSEAQDFVFVGPDWHGRLPRGMTRINSPYNQTFIIPRIYCAGGADIDKAYALQDQFDLRPLSAFGVADYTPPLAEVDPDIDMFTPPTMKILYMDAATYLETFMELLKTTPPPLTDLKMILKLQRAGFLKHKWYTGIDKLDPVVQTVLDEGIILAKTTMQQTMNAGDPVNWTFSLDAADYGRDYLSRAIHNYIGYGATIVDDIFYLSRATDSTGNLLINHKNYKIHFEPGQIPPVNETGFWSATIYNQNSFLVDEKNLPDYTAPTNYAVHTADVSESHYNEDGSLDIYITSYANKAANVPEGALWIPSPTPGNERFQPEGSQGLPEAPDTALFHITLRLFWAQPEALDGTWQPPTVLPY